MADGVVEIGVKLVGAEREFQKVQRAADQTAQRVNRKSYATRNLDPINTERGYVPYRYADRQRFAWHRRAMGLESGPVNTAVGKVQGGAGGAVDSVAAGAGRNIGLLSGNIGRLGGVAGGAALAVGQMFKTIESFIDKASDPEWKKQERLREQTTSEFMGETIAESFVTAMTKAIDDLFYGGGKKGGYWGEGGVMENARYQKQMVEDHERAVENDTLKKMKAGVVYQQQQDALHNKRPLAPYEVARINQEARSKMGIF